MQAISTKYLGPTNFRGSRVTACAESHSVTVGWDPVLNSEDNHRAAVMKLVAKLCWEGTWVGGGNPNGRGYTYVCIERAWESAFKATPTSKTSGGDVIAVTCEPVRLS